MNEEDIAKKNEKKVKKFAVMNTFLLKATGANWKRVLWGAM